MPFVSKAIGVPLAKLAAHIMVGKKLDEIGLTREVVPKHISVKEAVFRFNKFPGVDTLLGPEMKSTGEVMGIDDSFGIAFAKAQLGGGMRLPKIGQSFISVRDEDKASVMPFLRAKTIPVWDFRDLRHCAVRRIISEAQRLPTEIVKKVQDGSPQYWRSDQDWRHRAW